MIRACPKCKAKNRLPTDGNVNQLGRPVCASCGNYLFPENSESETNSFQTGEIGYIYILARKSGKIVKVGETSRDPSKRHKEYVAEYKLRDFELFRTFEVPLNARKDIEKLAHQKLQHLRLSLLEQGGAREIFECDTATAVKAIEEAKAESEINRIEQEKQRQQQIKRDKLAKAQANYDEQLEKFIEGWLREWEGSHWVKSKKSVLDKFVAGTPFEKEGKRTSFDYFVISLGWLLLILGCWDDFGGHQAYC